MYLPKEKPNQLKTITTILFIVTLIMETTILKRRNKTKEFYQKTFTWELIFLNSDISLSILHVSQEPCPLSCQFSSDKVTNTFINTFLFETSLLKGVSRIQLYTYISEDKYFFVFVFRT